MNTPDASKMMNEHTKLIQFIRIEDFYEHKLV